MSIDTNEMRDVDCMNMPQTARLLLKDAAREIDALRARVAELEAMEPILSQSILRAYQDGQSSMRARAVKAEFSADTAKARIRELEEKR